MNTRRRCHESDENHGVYDEISPKTIIPLMSLKKTTLKATNLAGRRQQCELDFDADSQI